MKFNKFILSAFLLMSAVLPYSLSADTMSLSSIGSSPLQQELIYFNHSSETVYAGGIAGTLNGGLSQLFFCIDLNNNINVPGTYTVTPTSPSANVSPSFQLSPAYNRQVVAALLNSVNPNSFSTNVDELTGLQLALWNILYNTSNPFVLGTSQTADIFAVSSSVPSNIISFAENFLTDAEGVNPNNTGNWLMMLNSTPNTQSLIGLGVPEPSTYALMGGFLFLGTIGMYFKRRVHA
jgi:hypothetical protein